MNQKAYKHIDKLDEEFFNPLRDKLVPDYDEAATVAGELIRAMDRLIYRFYNDGDMVGQGYGNETCNGSYRYLYRKLGDKCPNFFGIGNEDVYGDALATLCDNVKEYLETHPELQQEENHEDSRKGEPEDYQWYEEEDDEDYCEDY